MLPGLWNIISPAREHLGGLPPPDHSPGRTPPTFGAREPSLILFCVRNIPGKKNGPVPNPSNENFPTGVIFKLGCVGLSFLRQPFFFIVKINPFCEAPLTG